MTAMHLVYDDGAWHECVDDDDDHRILILRCGEQTGWTPAIHRMKWPPKPVGPTCLMCLMEVMSLW